jgi:hypothetical protein
MRRISIDAADFQYAVLRTRYDFKFDLTPIESKTYACLFVFFESLMESEMAEASQGHVGVLSWHQRLCAVDQKAHWLVLKVKNKAMILHIFSEFTQRPPD